MKPFDLDAAKRGAPVQTRDGRPVKFIAHEPEAEAQNLVVMIGDVLHVEYENGRRYTKVESPMDLFMVPRKRTVWVNLYCGGGATCHTSQDNADMYCRQQVPYPNRVGDRAWPLEIEK